jgi:AhpD family alkylhydroperoxidase
MSRPRLPYAELSSAAYQGLAAASRGVRQGPLDHGLIEMINLRVSQINGCAFCLAMHAKGARAAGVSAEKLDTLAGWPLSPAFDEKERAALAWAEAVTALHDLPAMDAAFEGLKAVFSDHEISDLTMVVAVMHAFNRIAIGMRQ